MTGIRSIYVSLLALLALSIVPITDAAADTTHNHVIIDFGLYGHTIRSLADGVEVTLSYRLVGREIEVYDQRHRASGFSDEPNYDCQHWSELAVQMVNTRNAKAWERLHAARVCSKFAYEAMRLVRDDEYFEWEFKWAAAVNSHYALQAFRKVIDTSYYEWELQYASMVDTPYALQVFSASLDDEYFDWELKWAAHANTPYARDAMLRIRAKPLFNEWEMKSASSLMTPQAYAAFLHVTSGLEYFDWQLRWLPFINTDSELEQLRALQNYDELQLYQVATADGLIGEFYEHLPIE